MSERESREESRKKFHKLLREIVRNPQVGLSKFYDVYGKLIQITAQAVCHSVDKACEVVDDVLIKVWKNAGSVGEIKNPEGWIYIITANTAKDAMRQKYTLPLDEKIVASDDKLQKLFEEDSFYSLIRDLSEIEQAILIEKFIAQNTFQEIAEDLNKPITTISSLYYRALDKLKTKLARIK